MERNIDPDTAQPGAENIPVTGGANETVADPGGAEQAGTAEAPTRDPGAPPVPADLTAAEAAGDSEPPPAGASPGPPPHDVTADHTAAAGDCEPARRPAGQEPGPAAAPPGSPQAGSSSAAGEEQPAPPGPVGAGAGAALVRDPAAPPASTLAGGAAAEGPVRDPAAPPQPAPPGQVANVTVLVLVPSTNLPRPGEDAQAAAVEEATATEAEEMAEREGKERRASAQEPGSATFRPYSQTPVGSEPDTPPESPPPPAPPPVQPCSGDWHRKTVDDVIAMEIPDLFIPRLVNTWGKCEIAGWLYALGLPQYTEAFRRNGICGRTLCLVTASNLPRMGITDWLHIRRLTGSVRFLLACADYTTYDRTFEKPPPGPMTRALYLQCARPGGQPPPSSERYLAWLRRHGFLDVLAELSNRPIVTIPQPSAGLYREVAIAVPTPPGSASSRDGSGATVSRPPGASDRSA